MQSLSLSAAGVIGQVRRATAVLSGVGQFMDLPSRAPHPSNDSAPIGVGAGENPFVMMRHRLGLGQAEFARTIGVSLPAVWGAEKGTTGNPIALLRALEHLGLDSRELRDGYVRWRREVVEEAGKRLTHQIDAANAADRLAATEAKHELMDSA